MKRRNFLMLVGGGVVLAAGAGTFARISRTPQTASLPWEQAGGPQYSDPRVMALSFAVLAPNPHNQQPWLVDLNEGEDTIVLRVDQTRLLPYTDPFNRQITIGLGCFTEVLRLAAAEQGYGLDLDIFPDGEDARGLDERVVVRARLLPGQGQPDPLFAHVLMRRSVK